MILALLAAARAECADPPLTEDHNCNGVELADEPAVDLDDPICAATVDADALLRAAAHFSDATVGVVCGGYRLKHAGSEGERVGPVMPRIRTCPSLA